MYGFAEQEDGTFVQNRLPSNGEGSSDDLRTAAIYDYFQINKTNIVSCTSSQNQVIMNFSGLSEVQQTTYFRH